MSKTYKKEKTEARILNREQKRKLQRLAKKASKEALAKMDDGLYNIFKAHYDVKVNIEE